MLKKLRHFKLSDKAINWFSSCLFDRKQKVVIINIESRTDNVVFGAPEVLCWAQCYFQCL